jgi:hypothetical protein
MGRQLYRALPLSHRSVVDEAQARGFINFRQDDQLKAVKEFVKLLATLPRRAAHLPCTPRAGSILLSASKPLLYCCIRRYQCLRNRSEYNTAASLCCDIAPPQPDGHPLRSVNCDSECLFFMHLCGAFLLLAPVYYHLVVLPHTDRQPCYYMMRRCDALHFMAVYVHEAPDAFAAWLSSIVLVAPDVQQL